MKHYIVWNKNKSEGVVFEDMRDALHASNEDCMSNFTSSLADHFKESYLDDEEGVLEMQTVDLSILKTFDNIRSWATTRNLDNPDRRAQQMLKLTEEAGELAGGIAKQKEEVVKDSIGDCVVVLTILAMQSGLTIEDCIEHAYNEIANRTGRTVGGVFVKDEV